MRILVSKINNLGDAVTFLPTLAAIRRNYPQADILVLCTDRTASIFEQSVPGGVRTVPVGTYQQARGLRALSLFPRLASQLGARPFDWALLSHDEPKLAMLLAVASKAARRIGFDLINKELQGMLTNVLPASPDRNIVDLNFDLVRTLTGQCALSPQRTPIGYNRADLANVAALLGIPQKGGTRLVVLHPFASQQSRNWPLDNYLHIARMIRTRLGLRVIFASEHEHNALAHEDCIAGLSIHALAALFERAALFIGSNSGPMHIAAAMGTPTISFQGPSPRAWVPPWVDAPHRQLTSEPDCAPCERLGQHFERCGNIASPSVCIRKVSPEDVFDATLDILKSESLIAKPSLQPSIRGKRLAMTPARITTIIPTFNSEKTIAGAIESFAALDYPNKELIVVDGASRDGTADILKRYESTIDYWVSEPDRGLYDAWNKGIARATGTWIHFLGSDDAYFDRAVFQRFSERAIHFAPDTLFAYGKIVMIDGKGSAFEERGWAWDAKFFRTVGMMKIPHQGAFHHRTLFDLYGQFAPVRIEHLDYEFLLRYLKDHDAVFMPDLWVSRMSAGGVSSDAGRMKDFLDGYWIAQGLHGTRSLNKDFAYYYAQGLFKCALAKILPQGAVRAVINTVRAARGKSAAQL